MLDKLIPPRASDTMEAPEVPGTSYALLGRNLMGTCIKNI